MSVKLFGIGIVLFGFYLIYVKRHLEDDSLLLGAGLILTGILLFITGWIIRLDARRK
jgi:hypothetical protein